MTGDGFAQTVADIARTLPEGHLGAWAEVLDRAAGPGPSVEAALIDARPGQAVATQARRLVTAWRAGSPRLPGPAVALALRSAAHVHRQHAGWRTDVVVSGPSSPSVPVRLTSSVVVEMVRAARRSLLVVSFAAYGVTEVITELAAAADRGVRIDLVLESSVGDGGALRGPVGAAAAFAVLGDRATFWHWPARSRGAPGVPRPALHAKIVVADDRTALISSANLTDRALRHNLEVGVVLRDPPVLRKLVAHFAALMNQPGGPLEPIRWEQVRDR